MQLAASRPHAVLFNGTDARWRGGCDLRPVSALAHPPRKPGHGSLALEFRRQRRLAVAPTTWTPIPEPRCSTFNNTPNRKRSFTKEFQPSIDRFPSTAEDPPGNRISTAIALVPSPPAAAVPANAGFQPPRPPVSLPIPAFCGLPTPAFPRSNRPLISKRGCPSQPALSHAYPLCHREERNDVAISLN